MSDIITFHFADYQNFDLLLIDDLEQSIDNKERRHTRNQILNDLISSKIPYLVLITREANLNQGFHEDGILTLREENGQGIFPVFYQDVNQAKSYYAEYCWVEDRKGGYNFIRDSLNIKHILSADGKSKIVKKLRKYLQKRDVPILLVYDRAGIGTEIMRIRTYITSLSIDEYVEYLAPLSIEELYILLSKDNNLIRELETIKKNPWLQNGTLEHSLENLLEHYLHGYKKAEYPSWCVNPEKIECYPLWNKYLKKK